MGDRASDSLRWNLDMILDQQGADMADLPGGASRLLVRDCRDYKGGADRLVTCIDPGAVSLLAELRGHERQAAMELAQWKTRAEECRVTDASPAAITLAGLCTLEQLEEMERRGLALQLELELEPKASA